MATAIISYSRDDLFGLNPGKVQISKELFDVLHELKIASSKRTHRGSRGGRHKVKRPKACQTEEDGEWSPKENNNDITHTYRNPELRHINHSVEVSQKNTDEELSKTGKDVQDMCTQTEEMSPKATNTNVCEITDELKAKLKKFRFRKAKTNAAIILKINKADMRIIEDDAFDEEDLEGMDPDTLSSELPSHVPRFVAYSYCYHHDDGRISYPLCLIHSAPPGCNTELQMMYAGSRNNLVKVGEFTKVFEVRNPEEIDEEWLKSKLAFFR
ncbi:glia maturation factor beta-like [Amphiura filiformis]|uniref:glia maturation factor beta-like n=1 Tax=Amphiura filiformis TaxID=82378 RepID=UPI003B2200A6